MLCNSSTPNQTPWYVLSTTVQSRLLFLSSQKNSKTLRKSLLRTSSSNPLLNFLLGQNLNRVLGENVAETGPDSGSCDEVSTQLA